MISKRDRSTNLKNNAGARDAGGGAGVAGNVMQCEPKGGFLIFLFFLSVQVLNIACWCIS